MTRHTKFWLAGAGVAALLCASIFALLGYHLVSFAIGKRHAARGDANLQHESYEAAAADYDRALQYSLGTRARAYALANRGVCEARRANGRAEAAIEDLTGALRLDGRLGYAYLERGTVYARQGNYDGGWEDYSRAIALDPNASVALHYRGMIATWRKQWHAAIADFSEAIRSAPKSPDPYVQRALAYEQIDDLPSARSSFDAALLQAPDHVDAYLERGKFFARHRDLPKAIKDFSRALAIAPHAVHGRRPRAQAYWVGEQWRDAIEDFSEILRAEPRDETALEMRGRTYSWLGESEPALADLSELIRITQSGHAYELRGRAFVRAGRYAEAVEDYRLASHQGSKRGRLTKGLAWLLATCPVASVRNGSQALEEVTQGCLQNESPGWNCFDTVAAAHAETGNFGEAVRFQEQALAAKNVNPEQMKEMEDRLALYRAGTPYRELPKP